MRLQGDVVIGLGSHDLDVATHSARLFPTLVFASGNSPTTAHHRLGVPAEAILLEPEVDNTEQNTTLSGPVS